MFVWWDRDCFSLMLLLFFPPLQGRRNVWGRGGLVPCPTKFWITSYPYFNQGRGQIMPTTLAWPHQFFWNSGTPATQLSLLTREIMTGEIKNTLPKNFSRGVGRPPTLKLSPDGKKSVNKAGFHFNFMPKKKKSVLYRVRRWVLLDSM